MASGATVHTDKRSGVKRFGPDRCDHSHARGAVVRIPATPRATTNREVYARWSRPAPTTRKPWRYFHAYVSSGVRSGLRSGELPAGFGLGVVPDRPAPDLGCSGGADRDMGRGVLARAPAGTHRVQPLAPTGAGRATPIGLIGRGDPTLAGCRGRPAAPTRPAHHDRSPDNLSRTAAGAVNGFGYGTVRPVRKSR